VYLPHALVTKVDYNYGEHTAELLPDSLQLITGRRGVDHKTAARRLQRRRSITSGCRRPDESKLSREALPLFLLV